MELPSRLKSAGKRETVITLYYYNSKIVLTIESRGFKRGHHQKELLPNSTHFMTLKRVGLYNGTHVVPPSVLVIVVGDPVSDSRTPMYFSLEGSVFAYFNLTS